MRVLILVLALALLIPACALPVEASTHEVAAPPFAARYDANRNNMVERGEAIAAVIDYFNGVITKEQAIGVIVLYFTGGPIQEQVAPNLAEVLSRVMPAVVKIVNDDAQAQGSGVLYKVDGSNGYLVTNQHVVRGAEEVTVTVGNTVDYVGTVLGVDIPRDLAVVRVCCDAGFPSVDFGDSEDLRIGDEVLGVGYPFDAFIPKDGQEGQAQPKVIVNPGVVSATVTRGIVSAVRYDSENDRDLLQTDTPVNPGNSGGPLFALDGTVVGVITFTLRDTEGLNFAVLETTVQEQIPRLEAGTPLGPKGAGVEFDFIPFAGPWPGHIHHEPDDRRFESVSTRFGAADVVVSARFHNPYGGDLHNFDYGFLLRDDGRGSFFTFLVDSEGGWDIRRRTVEGDSSVDAGLAAGIMSGLATEEGWSNHLLVGLVGEWAWFEVNGELLSGNFDETLFHVGVGSESGVVRLVTGYFLFGEQHGAATRFDGFLAEEIVTYGRVSTRADVERVVAAYRGGGPGGGAGNGPVLEEFSMSVERD